MDPLQEKSASDSEKSISALLKSDSSAPISPTDTLAHTIAPATIVALTQQTPQRGLKGHSGATPIQQAQKGNLVREKILQQPGPSDKGVITGDKVTFASLRTTVLRERLKEVKAKTVFYRPTRSASEQTLTTKERILAKLGHRGSREKYNEVSYKQFNNAMSNWRTKLFQLEKEYVEALISVEDREDFYDSPEAVEETRKRLKKEFNHKCAQLRRDFYRACPKPMQTVGEKLIERDELDIREKELESEREMTFQLLEELYPDTNNHKQCRELLESLWEKEKELLLDSAKTNSILTKLLGRGKESGTASNLYKNEMVLRAELRAVHVRDGVTIAKKYPKLFIHHAINNGAMSAGKIRELYAYPEPDAARVLAKRLGCPEIIQVFLEQEKPRLEGSWRKANRDLEGLQGDLDKAQKRLDKASKRMPDKNSDLHPVYQTQLTKAIQNVEEARGKLETAKRELESVKARLDKTKKELLSIYESELLATRKEMRLLSQSIRTQGRVLSTEGLDLHSRRIRITENLKNDHRKLKDLGEPYKKLLRNEVEKLDAEEREKVRGHVNKIIKEKFGELPKTVSKMSLHSSMQPKQRIAFILKKLNQVATPILKKINEATLEGISVGEKQEVLKGKLEALDGNRRKVEQLKKSMQELAGKISSNREVPSPVARARLELASLTEERDQLRKELTEQTALLQPACIRLKKNEANLAVLKEELAKLTDSFEDMLSKYGQTTDILTMSEGELERHIKSEGQFGDKLGNLPGIVKQCKSQKDAMQRKIQTAESELEAANKEWAENEEDLNVRGEEIARLEQEIEQVRQKSQPP